MKDAAFQYALFTQKSDKLRQKTGKKTGIFSLRSGGVPTENAAGLSIFLGDNLRCKLCAPLRKEMRYFKIFYSIFTCELKPYVKKGEIKGIAVIGLLLHRQAER